LRSACDHRRSTEQRLAGADVNYEFKVARFSNQFYGINIK